MEDPDIDIITLSSDDESKASNLVTSPKLSLKRNRTELTPDRKFEGTAHRLESERVSKKIKFDEQKVVLDEVSDRKHEITLSTSAVSTQMATNTDTTTGTTPAVSADAKQSTDVALSPHIIEVSDKDKEPFVIVGQEVVCDEKHEIILNTLADSTQMAPSIDTTRGTTPAVSTDAKQSTDVALSPQIIELSDEDKEPFVIVEDRESPQGAFQSIPALDLTVSSEKILNEKQDVFEDRKKKFIELFDFSATLMDPDEAPEKDKIKIRKKLVNLLDATQKSYVESENFNLLLDISIEKMKMKNPNVFDILNNIKSELKKHKNKSKKTIKDSIESILISSTDDSISKDVYVDSTSTLPPKVIKDSSDSLNINFSSRFDDYFKKSEKQQSLQHDSASCSSFTAESTKTFASTKKSLNNFRTAANSDKKIVSDDLIVINESCSSAELYSKKSNTSEFPSFNNYMTETVKSPEIPSTSGRASPEYILPVSDYDDIISSDLLLQSNKINSINHSNTNFQTATNSLKKIILNNFVTNDFCSSDIASAVGLCAREPKTSNIAILKNSEAEKLNSSKLSFVASTSQVWLPTTSSDHSMSGNVDVNNKLNVSSLPSTSRSQEPSTKFLPKDDDNSLKNSRSSSVDSSSIDRRLLLGKNEDDRNAKRIKKLEKKLKEIDKAIKKCQKADLSLDDLDDEDSMYIKESRYKKRFVEIYRLLCKFKNVPSRTGRIIEKKFHYQGSRYRLINEAVERFIDKKKAHEKFPDYSEILSLIREVDEKNDLGFDEVDISNEAKRVFEDIGETLKERRVRDERELLGCYLTDDVNLDQDPAEEDENLKKTLEDNNKKFKESINQVIDHYVEKQKLAPTEENAADDEDDLEGDEEKEEEETVASSHEDSDDLPGTAPASPAENVETPGVNIIDKDNDIEIINYSDRSTDQEEEVKKRKSPTVNKLNISETVLIEDSESSGDLPSIQELIGS